jgi:4-aminobutyrate aminotransferase/(S)-3-amino-2-methylpropionate transaminase
MTKLFICLYINIFLGIQMGSCGDVAVRFRPALIFAERHAQIVLDKMTEVAKKF